MDEFPKWVYPNGPENGGGVLVKDADAERVAVLAFKSPEQAQALSNYLSAKADDADMQALEVAGMAAIEAAGSDLDDAEADAAEEAAEEQAEEDEASRKALEAINATKPAKRKAH